MINCQLVTGAVQQRMGNPNSEDFCLNWNDFTKNVIASFRELRRDQEFSDVTLACGDGQTIEAHRLVLTSGSLVFHDLLRQNHSKAPHPLIYMRGLKTSDLNLIVDFLYQGEVNVPQDKLNDFLALAEELQLKGLSVDGPSDPPPTELQDPGKNQYGSLSTQQPKREKGTIENYPSEKRRLSAFKVPTQQSDEKALSLFGEVESKSGVSFRDGNTELDQQINSMMERLDGVWVCKTCDKRDRLNTNIKKHIEGIHIEGSTHSCRLCAKNFRSKNALQVHMSRNHKN